MSVEKRTPAQIEADAALDHAIAANLAAYGWFDDEPGIIASYVVVGSIEWPDADRTSYFRFYPGHGMQPVHVALGLLDYALTRTRHECVDGTVEPDDE